jgi:hypothetical protein
MIISDLIQAEAFDYAHAMTGALIVSWGCLLGSWHGALWAALGTFLFGCWKEFWWDIHYETPALSGGYLGGLRDLAGYVVGSALSLAALRILVV